jgi:predicted permease
MPRTLCVSVSDEYFQTLGISLLGGRAFLPADGTRGAEAAIVNERFVAQFLAGENPIGRRIRSWRDENVLREIVGIVADVRDGGLNRDPQPAMFIPWAQVPDAINALNVVITPIAWVVRTRVEPHSLTSATQRELGQVSGGLPVARTRTMDEIVVQSTARTDFNMLLLTIFGCAALLLAAIGIYGLMAYSVQQRTQEIGIRLALGAQSTRVRNMVIAQGMRIALVGVMVGIASSLGLTRVIASLLFGVTARDPLVFFIVPALLSGVALVGVWVPARRAALVDPVIALRAE